MPKPGQWHYEPKYNGWRALVHAPTGTMFNRYGQRLTIQREFSAALAALRALRLGNGAGIVEWYEANHRDRANKLKDLAADRLVKPILLFGDAALPAVSYLNIQNLHSAHHRGQLSTYLRPMGSKIPSIYGGSADEPMAM